MDLVEFCEWLKGLFTSHNFWGTIMGAFIGGMVALRITNKEVKGNEKIRQQAVMHENKMELMRLRIKESEKSRVFLSKLPKYHTEIHVLTLKIMKNPDMIIDLSSEKNQLIIETHFKLLELESSAKVCGLSEQKLEDCIKLRKALEHFFDLMNGDGLLKHVSEGPSPEDVIEELKSLDDFTQLVDKNLYNFRKSYEASVKEFEDELT